MRLMWYINGVQGHAARIWATYGRCPLFPILQYGTYAAPSRDKIGSAVVEKQKAPPVSIRDTSANIHKNVPYYGSGVTRQPVPLSASTVSWNAPEQPDDARIVKVALVGLPNAGKSSLMNALLKSPIAAVSPKVNTTREDIKGILCVDNCQMMFTDCPGILESHRRRKFCSPLVNTAWKAYDEADVCLFVLDAVKRPDATLFRIVRKLAGAPPFAPESDAYNHPAGSYGNGDQHQEGLRFNDQDDIDELMDGEESDVKDEFGIDDDIYTSVQQETRKPVALVLNKIDLVEHKKWVKSRTREMKNHGTFADVFYTSAKHGIGFKPMLEFLKTMAKPGMWVYPPNMLTTMSQVQVVEQMELPYRVGQKVIGWTVAENGSLIIEMELYVRNDKAAKVICGIQGRIVKQLQKNVSHRLSKMWNEPVFLYVQVKVKALL